MIRRTRRGAVVGLLLLVLVFLSGFVALGMNVVRLQNVQTQLRAASQTAALAAAAELVDEGLLVGVSSREADVAAARRAAQYYAARNTIDGRPLQLDRNEANAEQGDIVIGWMNPAGPAGQQLQLPESAGPIACNTVRVTSRLARNLPDRLTSWFGSVVGLTHREIVAQSQASIDCRIAGFRPEPDVNVPVAPLVAEYGAWISGATARAAAGVNDAYFFDPATGLVSAGADGLPEFTLLCGGESSSAAVSTAVIRLADEANRPYVWSDRCRRGLSIADLQPYGGELVLRRGVLPIYVVTLPDDLPYCLTDILGQVRAWPLGEPNANDRTSWTIVGFAAARIVDVRRLENASSSAWAVVVQPATLVCSQAVAAVEMNPNPWIAKLELTQ